MVAWPERSQARFKDRVYAGVDCVATFSLPVKEIDTIGFQPHEAEAYVSGSFHRFFRPANQDNSPWSSLIPIYSDSALSVWIVIPVSLHQ